MWLRFSWPTRSALCSKAGKLPRENLCHFGVFVENDINSPCSFLHVRSSSSKPYTHQFGWHKRLLISCCVSFTHCIQYVPGCVFPLGRLKAPVASWPGSPPVVLPVRAIYLSIYMYMYIYIYIYQGYAVSVCVVWACGVSCCHLPCRVVLDGLAC